MATSDSREIRAEILLHFRDSEPMTEVRAWVDKTAEEAAEYAKSIAPVRTGAYKNSIHTEAIPDVNDLPARRVIADDFKAIFIEYGTGEPGPTPEFGVFAKTVQHFDEQGDMREGIGVTGDVATFKNIGTPSRQRWRRNK